MPKAPPNASLNTDVPYADLRPRTGPPVSSISFGRKVARRTVKFHRLAYVLASFIASLAACNTTQVSEDYFEPSGAGQLVSRRGALSSPST